MSLGSCGALTDTSVMAATDDLLLSGIAHCLMELLDSCSSSSSSSSEEELNMLEAVMPHLEIPERRRKSVPRLKNYVEEVIPRWLDSDFKSHFRMRRDTFEYVLGVTGKSLSRIFPGLPMISPEKQLLLTIWRMATPDSYRSICEKFDVSRSTALTTVRRVTGVLIKLAPVLIKWPSRANAEAIWNGFEAISAFPKVLGAIDGTHVQIPAPKVNPEAYVNRKKYHSLQLQAVCDHKARFIHCLVGHVGSVHDQRVFRLSEVADYLGNEDRFPDDCHLVGDLAYKLHENLLVPYCDTGHLSRRESNFNFCLSSARIAIERAFGLLKGRFRSLLHCLAMLRTEEVPDFVLACCVLHNLCLLKEDEIDIIMQRDVEILHDDGEEGSQLNVGAAIAKRDLICQRLQMRAV